MSRPRFPVKPPGPKPNPPVPKPPKPVPKRPVPKPPAPKRTKVSRAHPSIRERASRIAERFAKTAEEDADGCVEVGRELIEVKENLVHGQWEIWVREDAPLEVRMAQRLMKLASWAGEHRALFVAHRSLGSSKLHLIAIQPPEVQRAAFSRKLHRVPGRDAPTRLERVSYRELWALLRTLRPPKSKPKKASDEARKEYHRALMALKKASKKVTSHAGVIKAARAAAWREKLLELADELAVSFALDDE